MSLFNSESSVNSKRKIDQDLNRGLALLAVIAVSIIGSSWLLFLPVYFDLKIAAQIFPLLITLILLFAVTRIQHVYLNYLAAPFGYLLNFSSWSFVIYLNAVTLGDTSKETISDLMSTQLTGMSDSMYILGLCLITMWLGRYFKYAIYLSSLSILSLVVLLQQFSNTPVTLLITIFLLLSCCVAIAQLGFKIQIITPDPVKAVHDDFIDEDMLLPAEEEVQEIIPELEINTLPLNEMSGTHDWELILRELNTELKNTSDVDQLFKSMLVFLHGAMEFDAAAVGMLQDKSIKKIAKYGDDEYLHTQSLSWTNQRIESLFKSREAILSKQPQLSASAADEVAALHRLDIPVISNNKVLGVVTLFRDTLLFDMHDVKIASSIVFHSMIALRQARLQDEIKRLSSESTPAKLTLYTREQFVSKVKPVLEKLGKPRECSLFIVELDNIDFTIDTVSRDAGAALYRAVSKVILSLLKESDILGAYGKEGFIIMLDETNLMSAKETAEKIRSKVSKLKLNYKGGVITTTISIGLTIVSDPDEDLASVMRKADMGLFVAKENGSNTIKVSF